MILDGEVISTGKLLMPDDILRLLRMKGIGQLDRLKSVLHYLKLRFKSLSTSIKFVSVISEGIQPSLVAIS